MSNKIKAYRILNDYTQDDVAKKIGKGIAAYNRKENNPELFTIGEARKLAVLFNTTLDEIFYNNEVALKVANKS